MSRVVEHLSNLVRIPSVSSMSNRPVIEYAEQVLHAAGWKTLRQVYIDDAQVEKINLVAAPAPQSLDKPDTALAFMCHTDTVPYASTWAGALDLREERGFLYGCGACDVKGFMACLLAAAENAVPENSKRIILTADEEIGCIGAKHLLSADLVRPARLVIGEPTSMHPARAGKGYCLGRVTVTGREAHSAHPEQGASAIHAAAHLLIGLEELAADLRRTVNDFFTPPYTTLNVGIIQGGSAKNIIPGACTFLVEWRPIPGAPAEEVPTAIDAVLEKQRRKNPRIHYVFEIERRQQGFETAADSVLVRSIERLAGKPAVAIPFGSEASTFARIGKDIVVFGPGDMQTAHSDRECVEIAQLHQAVSCIHSLILAC